MSERECPYCHRTWPDTVEYFRHNLRKCRECERERKRQYGRDHPEKIRERNQRWYKANAERAKELIRQRYHANPEKARKRARQYRQTHLEEHNEHSRQRRAKKRNGQTQTDVTVAKIADLKKRSKGKCYWCGKKAKPMHIDHIMPLSKGGPHMMWNLCISCAKCNMEKHDKMPQEMGVLL